MRNLFKFSLLAIFAAVIVAACMKDEKSNDDSIMGEVSIENRDASEWICHKPDGNNPHAIWVDEDAVDAHLGHGDVLLDADGDGYTAPNECGEGSMDDCDDNNANVYPGIITLENLGSIYGSPCASLYVPDDGFGNPEGFIGWDEGEGCYTQITQIVYNLNIPYQWEICTFPAIIDEIESTGCDYFLGYGVDGGCQHCFSVTSSCVESILSEVENLPAFNQSTDQIQDFQPQLIETTE